MDYKEKIKNLIKILINEGASDLHLSEGRVPFIRVSGSLVPALNQEVLSKEDTDGIVKVLLGENKYRQFIKNMEMDFSYEELGVRLRGNSFFQRGFVSIALRLIPPQIKSLQELGLPSSLENFCRREQGFFLVVGPVGHGKSTTLSSMIDLINKERSTHIVTVEDPIEYIHKQNKSIIDQREVKMDTKDFSTALRSIFRQDVDVVLIGEMRGVETMSTAVTAAETGHLVFSTLHTNSASQTIDRIIDSFPADQQNQIKTQLAGSLAGIFSQRLIPRVSGGLVPAYELLINNSAISNLIREGRTHEINSIIETSSSIGMIDLNRSLADLVRRGEITIEDAFSYSLRPSMLNKLV